jgi:hypothetical protein
MEQYDLKKLYHIHRVYEVKRQRIQRLLNLNLKLLGGYYKGILTVRETGLKTSCTS